MMAEGCSEDFEAGVFLVDKPPGVSSFGVVSRMKRVLGIKKVGHAGTLDPFATGLLIVCAGRPATRLISGFMDWEKEYTATLRLGIETSTQDPEGEIIRRKEVGFLSGSRIQRSLLEFRGHQKQVPPAYSALKHKGKPLYYYARKGINVVKEPREIEIRKLDRIDGDSDLIGSEPEFSINVVCSKGTYIRTLAADIGHHLECGAYLIQLRRNRIGHFSVDNTISWQDLERPNSRDFCLGKMIQVQHVAKLLQ